MIGFGVCSIFLLLLVVAAGVWQVGLGCGELAGVSLGGVL